MLARGSKNILRGVSKSAMEKFIINGDHINVHASDVMNWWCPDLVHCTVSMCVERNDIVLGAVVNNMNVIFSTLHIKAVVL